MSKNDDIGIAVILAIFLLAVTLGCAIGASRNAKKLKINPNDKKAKTARDVCIAFAVICGLIAAGILGLVYYDESKKKGIKLNIKSLKL